MDPVSLRALERIIGVIIGGISVYLGYRLFHSLPDQMDSEGKFILPGNISVYMSRVGPGAFFALFGVVVVIASLYFSLKIQKDVNDQPGVERSFIFYLGAGETLKEARANVSGDIFLLNQLHSSLRGKSSAIKQTCLLQSLCDA
jgi:hypothetical protein